MLGFLPGQRRDWSDMVRPRWDRRHFLPQKIDKKITEWRDSATGRADSTRAKEHALYVRNGRFDLSVTADQAIIHQHSLSVKNVQIVDHEPRAARSRTNEALHNRTEKNPMNKDKRLVLELDPNWFTVVWISVSDFDYTRIFRTQNIPYVITIFHCYLSCVIFMLSPSSSFLVTLDALCLIHKHRHQHWTWRSPDSDARHLPDSSRKSTSR